MTCGTCKHWSLEGELGRLGHGICKARPEPYRAAITTSARLPCRIGRYVEAKPVRAAVQLAGNERTRP